MPHRIPPVTDTITVAGIDVGLAGAEEQRLAWSVRLKLKNTSDQSSCGPASSR